MARNLKDRRGNFQEALDDQVALETRMSNRAGIIRDACAQITSLEAERRAISEQIGEVKAKLVKGDLGMRISDFNVALRAYKLEDDRKAEFIDAIRESFAALSISQTLDWVDALDKAASNEP